MNDFYSMSHHGFSMMHCDDTSWRYEDKYEFGIKHNRVVHRHPKRRKSQHHHGHSDYKSIP